MRISSLLAPLFLLALHSGQSATTITTAVVWSGSSAPGGSHFGESASNTSYTTFGIPAVNAAGQVSFGASVNSVFSWPINSPLSAPTITPTKPSAGIGSNSVAPTPGTLLPKPKTTNSWSGIWNISTNGTKTLVARVGAPFMVMDAGGFGTLSEPVLNNANVSAYAGTYYAGFIMPPILLPGASITNFYSGSGVWTSTSYSPAAFVGETAPGYTNPFTTSVGTLSNLLSNQTPTGFRLSNSPITFTNLMNFSSIDRVVLPDTGGVIFSATVGTANFYNPPVPTSPPYVMPMYVASQPLVQHGIWAQSGSGSLSLVAREGELLNIEGSNKTVKTISFLTCTNEAGGQNRSFNQRTGDLVYSARFADGSQALILESSTNLGGAPMLITATGDRAPGFSSNTLFTSFGNPVLNASNHVAFQANASSVTSIGYGPKIVTPGSPVIDPLPPSYWSGIWADDAKGNLQLIVQSRRTGGVPFVGGNGFTFISDPVYNNSNNVAFTGTWYSDGTPVKNAFNGGTGVWTSRNLTKPVAWIGQQAPGYTLPLTITVSSPYAWSTNKITFTSIPPIFSSFDRIALPDTGRLILWATVSATNNVPRPPIPVSKGGVTVVTQEIRQSVLSQHGIWLQNASGGLDLVVREGATLNVNGKIRVIASLATASADGPTGSQSRSFNQTTGTITYRAIFTDGTQAIMKVTFP